MFAGNLVHPRVFESLAHLWEAMIDREKELARKFLAIVHFKA